VSQRRIAFIDYFPPHYRRGLYEELARRTDADFLFFSDEREKWQNRKIRADRGGEYRVVELRKIRIAGQALLPGIVRRLSPQRYDAVIKNLNGKLMMPLTFMTAGVRGVPSVLWTGMWHHPTTPTHRISHAMTRTVYRRVGAIVVYGEHVKRFLVEAEGVDPSKIFVAGQAVDPRRFEAVEPARNGTPTAIFIGQLKEYKGVLTLIDAWKRLEPGFARLRVVGNGPLENALRERIGDREDIELVGYVPQEGLPAELTRANLMVLPSETTDMKREPWGLVTNEAMHAGLPVIASSAVGAAAHGLVQDGRNGLVVPERDAEALAGALRRLLEDGDTAARLGAQAREDVRAFTYERMADAFLAAVEHAIVSRRRA
jgi:glycosyltransferase involved in cell wall biosynthesis